MSGETRQKQYRQIVEMMEYNKGYPAKEMRKAVHIVTGLITDKSITQILQWMTELSFLYEKDGLWFRTDKNNEFTVKKVSEHFSVVTSKPKNKEDEDIEKIDKILEGLE